MQIDDVTPEDFEPFMHSLAEYVPQVESDYLKSRQKGPALVPETTNLVYLDFGGMELRPSLTAALRRSHIWYRQFIIDPSTSNREGYRLIQGVRTNLKKGSAVVDASERRFPQARNLVLVENYIHKGAGILGAVIYSLEQREHMGKYDKLHVVAFSDDRGGVADFAICRGSDRITNLTDLMKERAPKKTEQLRERGLLDYLACTDIHSSLATQYRGTTRSGQSLEIRAGQDIEAYQALQGLVGRCA